MTRVERLCEHCGSGFEFQASPSNIAAGRGRFCSAACFRTQRNTCAACICQVCGATFSAPRARIQKGQAIYCSIACQALASRTAVTRGCEYCGKDFDVTPSRMRGTFGRFCSRACGAKGRKTSVVVPCEYCGGALEVPPARLADGRGRYCSHRCRALGHIAAHGTKLLSITTSTLERRIRAELDRRTISYFVNQQLGPYWPDLVFMQGLIVEIDGDYWHTLPGSAEKDARRDVYLQTRGYRVLHLWEHEINADLIACVDQIAIALSAAPESV